MQNRGQMIMDAIYKNGNLSVDVNASDEVFVRLETPKGIIQLRITPSRDSLICTAGNGQGVLTPWSTNRLPAFVVSKEAK